MVSVFFIAKWEYINITFDIVVISKNLKAQCKNLEINHSIQTSDSVYFDFNK